MAFQEQKFSFLFVAVDLLNPHPCCEVDSGLAQKWGYDLERVIQEVLLKEVTFVQRPKLSG